MVHCGRPSTSCDSCRAKKRRCDKALPECGQCRRTGYKCGYRDPLDLIFHDESSNVIDKARSRAMKSTTTSTATSQERRPAEYISSHSLPKDEMLWDATAQGTFSFEAGSGFVDNHLPLDFFDNFDNTLFPSGNSYSLYPDNFDPILAPSGASLESDTRDDEDSEEEGNENNDGDGEDPYYNDQNTANSEAASQNTNAIARPFSLPLDMMGLNFFLSHYVVRQSGPSSGFLDYTIAILAQGDSSELLEGAILALGYTGLAHTTQQEALTRRSMTMYSRTKERLNRALADPHESRQDGTIVAMLILALYEFSNNYSLEGWKHQVEGAASLLALRGKTQFATAVGIHIFKDVFFQVLISCIYGACPLPPKMRMLRIEASEALGASDPYWVATSAAVELLDLYRHICPDGYSFLRSSSSSCSSRSSSSYSSTPSRRSGTLNMSLEDVECYLSQALEIDQRLESLFSECSPEWQFATTINSPISSSLDRSCVQGDVYHTYHDVCVASVWNLMRICRILCNHAIGHLVLRAASTDGNWFFSNKYADRLQQVSRIMIILRDEIFAAVPQQIGYVTSQAQEQQQQRLTRSAPGRLSNHETQLTEGSPAATSSAVSSVPASLFSYPSASPFSSDQITYTGSAAGGYFASWALVMVGSMHCLGDEPRAWTVAQLRRISVQAALNQADDFANCMESDRLRPSLS